MNTGENKLSEKQLHSILKNRIFPLHRQAPFYPQGHARRKCNPIPLCPPKQQ